MITGISLSETNDYISKSDTGEPKTVWKIGVIDADAFASLGEYSSNPLRMMLELVRYGLKGVENFTDANGNDVKFSTVSKSVGPYSYRVVADSILKIIPAGVITEIGAEILRLSQLGGEEAKN